MAAEKEQTTTGVEDFDVVDVIRDKRDRHRLSDAQIDWVVDAYTRGVVADEQMSALAMAIFLNGMEPEEIARWTNAMIDTGERMSFDDLGKVTADKHSTGGVGDKVTLPLAPLVASYGVAVPQLSGRGLGHTGGTLDKLEAIPGWSADVSNARLREILADPGCVICAPGADLVPADKRLYALRDVTATVDCIPLIASSIMSKKIAEGAGSLTLDVKVGSGAFMKDAQTARALAETMVRLGKDSGLATSALLTDMSRPLGRAIGNALEVEESVAVLAGGGPEDLVELTVALADEMLTKSGVGHDDLAERLADGRAMDTWKAMIRAQGGDPDAELPRATHTEDVVADRDGWLTETDALAFGVASWRLGAGRARKEDPVQAGAGIELHAVVGDKITAGQKLFTLHTDTPERIPRALEALTPGFTVGDDEPAERTSVILDAVK